MALNIFNFENEKEFISFDLQTKKNCIVKMQGTTEDPYFCGKDLCAILEISNIKYALQNQVEDEDKKSLTQLQEEMMGWRKHPTENPTHPKVFIGKIYEKLSYNDGKAVYISEAGFYSLVLSSRVPFAKEFKRKVCKEILPAIRKYGEYSVKKEYEKRIAEIEQEKAKQIEALSEKTERMEKEKEALSEKNQRMERRIKRTKDIIENIKLREKKNEWIYVATSANYEKERIFKIGSTERLSKRLSTYNTGRVEADVFFYCWVKPCYKCRDLDYAIQNLLSDFKMVQSQEMYKGIKFADLRDILEFVCENYDKSIEFVNAFVRERLERSLEEDDEPVPRVDVKNVTLEYSNGIKEIVPVENLELEDVRNEVLRYIEECGKSSLRRKELVDAVSEKIRGIDKKTIWSETKDALGWKNSKTPVIKNITIVY